MLVNTLIASIDLYPPEWVEEADGSSGEGGGFLGYWWHGCHLSSGNPSL